MNRRWVVRGRLNRHYNTGDGGIRVALDGMGWKMGGTGGRVVPPAWQVPP
ncbi:MAG: hypothetical protein ACTSUE_00965 [Promethearchaeota archaeon]